MSLLYQKNKLGILYISVDYDKVFEALEENTQKNYGIYIVDSAGSEVYEFHSFTGENVDKALNLQTFVEYGTAAAITRLSVHRLRQRTGRFICMNRQN